MTNILKLINLKDWKSIIKKYDLNKPLWNNNYLLHYLGYTSDIKLFKELKNKINSNKIDLYVENSDGDNIYILLAKNGNIELLKEMIKINVEYIYNTNNNSNNLVFYLVNTEKVFMEFVEFIFKYNKKGEKVDIIKLINNNTNHINYIFQIIFSQYKFNNIKKIIEIDNFNFNNYKSINFLIFLLENKNLKKENIIYFLNNNTKKLNYENLFNNSEVMFISLLNKKEYDILDIIINNIGLDIDIYYNLGEYNLFRIFYNDDYNSSQVKYLYKYTDPKKLDRFGNNILNFILEHYINYNVINNSILKDLFELDIDFNLSNVEGKTVWHNIPFLKNIDKYFDKFKNKFAILKKDKNNKTFLDYAKENKNINLFKNIKVKNINNSDKNFELTNKNKVNYTLFSAKQYCLICYFIYLIDKYKNITVPIINSIDINSLIQPKQMVKIPNIKNDILFNYFFNPMYVIEYKSKDEYYINKNLNIKINEITNNNNPKGKYDYIILFLDIIEKSNYHANIILYDIKNLRIEHFDPYGELYFDTDMHDILEEELTWNTNYKYYSMENNSISFQSISDELNPYSQVKGDFGGFCLAWCIWFIEERVTNNINSKKLIPKLIKNMLNKNIDFMEYIRSFGHRLTNEKIKLLNIAGIDFMDYYKENYTQEMILKLQKMYLYKLKELNII